MHSLSPFAIGDIPLSLKNDSPSSVTSYGPYKGPNVEDITWSLRMTGPKVQAQCESYGHATTIDTLPNDVLLEIFYSCQTDDDSGLSLIPASCRWVGLVRVCRRWRQIVFGSPLRLDLQLLCTHRTPLLRKNLGFWPPFPLAVVYGHHQRLTSYDEDNLSAALEHPDRIRHVDLNLPSSQLSKVVTEMQQLLPALKHLSLLSKDRNALVVPGGFLGGAAPCLQRITLGGIIFPALPTLLSSSTDLVSLNFYDIPRNGYISPEAMVTCLAALPRLETFLIGFQSATSRPDRIRLPPVTRTVLPSLTYIEFRGASEYLEKLVSQIDGPRLNQIHITYLNQLVDFQVAQPFKFVDRSEELKLTPLRYADVIFTNALVSLEIYQSPPHHPNRVSVKTSILCQGIDWQVSHIAGVLSHRSTILSNVVDLKLEGCGADEDRQLESADNAEWLLLLRQFSAVRTLYLSRELVGHVALALEGVTEELAAEVLPALNSICLANQLASSVDKFVAVRRLCGRPVNVIGVNVGGVSMDRMLDYNAGRTLSEQVRRSDKLLEYARSLFVEYEPIHSSDFKVIKDKITFTSEMKSGHVTGVALSLCRIHLSCKDAFPTPQMKEDWAVTVLREACAKTGANLHLFSRYELFTDGDRKLFVNTKKRIMHVVEAEYGFDTSNAPDSISGNVILSRALLSDMAFIYPESNPGGSRHHPYRHPAFQKAINLTWFRDRIDDGVVFHEYFSPLTVPAIAFILTVVECCIDEWTDGTRKETEWDERRFKIVYQSHITSLNDFRQHGTDRGALFEHIRNDLLKEARKHAGVPPVPVTELGRHSQAALDAAHQEDLPTYPDQGLQAPEIDIVSDDSEE